MRQNKRADYLAELDLNYCIEINSPIHILYSICLIFSGNGTFWWSWIHGIYI